MDDTSVFAEFERITAEEMRLDRIARGEPTMQELSRFAHAEIDSPPAPPGFRVHSSHRPQTKAAAARENPEGGRYCMRCCVLVDVAGVTTHRGMDLCVGKRTIVLGDDDELHWVIIPEVK